MNFERQAWLLVFFTLFADVLTTVYGLRMGLSESNPVAVHFISEWGILGMFTLKAAAVLIAVCASFLLAREYRAVAPTALAFPWLIAVVINSILILHVSL